MNSEQKKEAKRQLSYLSYNKYISRVPRSRELKLEHDYIPCSACVLKTMLTSRGEIFAGRCEMPVCTLIIKLVNIYADCYFPMNCCTDIRKSSFKILKELEQSSRNNIKI